MAQMPSTDNKFPISCVNTRMHLLNFADEQTDDLLGLTLIQHLFEFADF